MDNICNDKVANTKRLLKKLFVVGSLFAAFHYMSADTKEPKLSVTKIAVSSIDGSTNKLKVKLAIVAKEVVPLILNFSIDIDLKDK